MQEHLAEWLSEKDKEIRQRDKWQFELKNSFPLNEHLAKNVYGEEIYFFIPHALQVNEENYSKEQFYRDETNIIRYKSPIMTLSDLGNETYYLSPLCRLKKAIEENSTQASDELKLFAVIFRAAVRKRVAALQEKGDIEKSKELCRDLSAVLSHFRRIKENYRPTAELPLLYHHFRYVDEFVSIITEEALLELPPLPDIKELISSEIAYREKERLYPKKPKEDLFAKESVLLRQRLLQGFVSESLFLKHRRTSPRERGHALSSAFAAILAALLYIPFLIWRSTSFFIQSVPFLLLAAFLYVIRDALKESIKQMFAKHSHRWFPDYSTKISNFKGFELGKLTEDFAFISLQDLPEGLLELRNYKFHEELQALQRHESVLRYKREMTLYPPKGEKRRREVTTFFRLNLAPMLEKASSPFQKKAVLDPQTGEITTELLPKVYHINMLVKNTYTDDDLSLKEEVKAYRVVVDKEGIKRVEQVYRA